MSLFETRRHLNVAMIGLHLGLQLIVGYWAVVIDDGYQCQQQSIQNVTYFGYTLIVFNLLAYAFFKSRAQPQFVKFIHVIINLGLVIGIFYFTIDGFNRYNNCAPSRVLYQFMFIETVLAIFLCIVALVGPLGWSDRYSFWIGNIAWPILFLSFGYPIPLFASALVIGIIFAVLFVVGLFLNCYTYSDEELPRNKQSLLQVNWVVGMVLIVGLQILAIVMLATTDKTGDYNWQFGRKVFVIFAGVNLIDIFFYLYAYRRLRSWSFVK